MIENIRVDNKTSNKVQCKCQLVVKLKAIKEKKYISCYLSSYIISLTLVALGL